MLGDLHATDADRPHDSLRFEHSWLTFEVLSLIWDHMPDQAPELYWPLDSTHRGQEFRSVLERAQHRCNLCAVPVVTFDAKYGLTCPLCNHREGGAAYFPAIDCSVLFGCQEPPSQGSAYCRMHTTQPSPPNPSDPRILRHRDTKGAAVQARRSRYVGSICFCTRCSSTAV